MRVVITGSGLFTPAAVIGNAELVDSFNAYVRRFNAEHAVAIAEGDRVALQESSAAFIEKVSGIQQRHVLDAAGILDIERMRPRLPSRSDDDLSLQAEIAVAAAKEALASAGRDASEVDCVIVACANLQRAYPAVAIEVQHALGCRGYAYDMNVACSSATFAIQQAVAAIQTGQARHVLVINPEITSAHLDFRDRDSHFIFGDVCTALLIEGADVTRACDAYEVVSIRLQTQFSNSIRNNFGFINRCEDDDASMGDKLFRQHGRRVFREVVPMVVRTLTAQLESHGLGAGAVRRMWLHQANINMNEWIVQALLSRPLCEDDAPIVLREYANTSSAGSIVAFHKHRQGLSEGDHGILCSFGAGYSIGSILLRKQ